MLNVILSSISLWGLFKKTTGAYISRWKKYRQKYK
jgi:hypothetical protein